MKNNDLALGTNGSASNDWFETRELSATQHNTHNFYTRFGKRTLDIVLCLALLPLFAPLIGLFWALTRRDGGPGFFAQDRLGKDGRVFQCLKLRTMLVDAEDILEKICAEDPELAAEWHLNQKLKNDPRITKVGKFLRKTSLDELPQFWNVLIGDMSFVGPRPMLVSQEALYRSGGGGESYFMLRPGITGAWQIDGRGTTSFLDRVRFDNSYWAKITMWSDLMYILRTVTVVFRRTGA